MSEEYMNKKVRPILEQIIDSLLDKTPDDPILFTYTWLVNYKNSETLKDRLELESLRKKVKEYEKQNDFSIDKKNYKESFIKDECSSELPSIDLSS